MRISTASATAIAALILLPLGLTVAQTTSKTGSTVKKKSSTTTTSKRRRPTTTVRKSGTVTAHKTGTTAHTTTAAKAPVAPKQTWRTRQLQPTPDRYKEIQQALVSKGYLAGEQSGAWNPQSADALRRFQTDQNLDATGKINSLSLIALGLGPKRETVAAVPPQQPASPRN